MDEFEHEMATYVGVKQSAESLCATYKGRQTETFVKYSALSLVVFKNKTSNGYAGIDQKEPKAA